MFIAQFFRPLLTNHLKNLKISSFANLRSFSHHEIKKVKRAEMRMSPNVFRQKKFYKAVVKAVFDASKSIKILRLQIPEKGFYFKAGQWVDFYAPDIEEVTGYSMTSAPWEAKQHGTLELAVKYGKFPPTQWVHNKCKEGDEVSIRVGGDFFYDPEPGSFDEKADLLLIGGGVGVNPLVSILCEYCHVISRMQDKVPNTSLGKVHVLYSAKTLEELVFMEKFKALEKQNPTINCTYYITNPGLTFSNQSIKCQRIQEKDVVDSLKDLQRGKVLCFICGPSTMTDDMALVLLKLGIPQSLIRYEKWW